MTYSSSSSAARYAISSLTRPFSTLRYGVSMKPKRLMRAEAREVADQTDVRAFRRLDRAHAAVVARVHVSDLEAGALTRQTTRSERREAALVREPRERVRLVHELRELRRPEELLDRRDHGPDVDQRLRRDRLDVLGRHALAHDPLHAAQADTQLVLDQLADGAHPAVAEVVDVVGEVAGVAVVQLHEVRDRREDVGLREREVAAAALDVARRGSSRSKRLRPRSGYSFESFFETLCRPTFAWS